MARTQMQNKRRDIMTTHGRKATEPVVVLLHWDGWVEVFGHVDARILNVPDVPPAADQFYNPAGEILAEQYVETQLPVRHRKAFMPGLRTAVSQIETLRPRDIQRRKANADFLKSIKEARRSLCRNGRS